MNPPQVRYRYIREDLETFEINGEKFVRDYELERTIIRNNLLRFPSQFYELPPSEKEKRGWNIASAFGEEVASHRLSWKSLEKDYGIPKKYIDTWKSMLKVK
ncbi:Uncharacterised protein [uncultured archaeon]|nr:Uncharacterised protein [uncultured archaeon]